MKIPKWKKGWMIRDPKGNLLGPIGSGPISGLYSPDYMSDFFLSERCAAGRIAWFALYDKQKAFKYEVVLVRKHKDYKEVIKSIPAIFFADVIQESFQPVTVNKKFQANWNFSKWGV